MLIYLVFSEILVGSIGMYFTYEYCNAIKGQVTLSYIIHKTYLLTRVDGGVTDQAAKLSEVGTLWKE